MRYKITLNPKLVDQQEIARLCDKLMSGTITDDELKKLDEWYNQRSANDVAWKGDDHEEGLRERLFDAISAKLEEESPRQFRRPSRTFHYAQAAAACVIVLLSAGIFWKTDFFEKAPVQTEATDPFDLPPGTKGAILVLGNGDHIELDKDDNKAVVEQSGATVYNNTGTLSYIIDLKNAMDEPMVWNTIIIPKGKEYRLTLSDGSQVWLNSASQLRFPPVFKGSKREVVLEGEAYFEIAKNARLPFVVVTGNTSVEVLGTHFNVKAYRDEADVKTTLLEGSVRVTHDGSGVVIAPGEQAISQAGRAIVVQAADLDQVMAWQQGFFEFGNTPLRDIVRQISRWYDVEIRYEGATGRETYYGGSIRKDLNLKDVLMLLRKNGAHVEVQDGVIIVHP